MMGATLAARGLGAPRCPAAVPGYRAGVRNPRSPP